MWQEEGRGHGATRSQWHLQDGQKEEKDPWDIVETEARRAESGEGKCLVQRMGRKGDAEGSRGGGRKTQVGIVRHWERAQQHRGVGR